MFVFFFSSRRRHTRYWRDWSSDVCSSDLLIIANLLDVTHGNNLTVNFNALLCEFLCYSSSINRTIKVTCNGNLGNNFQSHAIESLCLLLCFSLKSSQLVSLLSQVLSQNLLCAGRSDNSQIGRASCRERV